MILNEVTTAEDLGSCRGLLSDLQIQRLVEARAHGPFRSFKDIQVRVRGIGKKTLHKLKMSTSPMFFLTKENFYGNEKECHLKFNCLRIELLSSFLGDVSGE